MNTSLAGAPESSTRPALSLSSRSQVFQGMAYGLEQPALLVSCTVELAPTVDFAGLDSAMEVLFKKPLPNDFHEPSTPELGLLKRLHHWHLFVQQEVSIPVFGHCFISAPGTTGEDSAAHYGMALPYFNAKASVTALNWTIKAVNRALAQPQLSATELAELRSELDSLNVQLRNQAPGGTNVTHFLEAAHILQMPATRLANAIFSLGMGANSCWFHSSITGNTASIGVGVAKNKVTSATILSRYGLPVPRHAVASSEEDALKIAHDLGFPVVVKPTDQDQGRGVFAGLRTEQSLGTAFRAAREFSSHILVETEEKANELKAEIDGGADFAELARENSIDPGAANGGDLGFFGRGMMVQPFEEAVFALANPGDVSAPVQSQFGWHVIKLEEKRDSAPPSFEQVAPQIQNQLLMRSFTEKVDALMEGVEINIEDPELKAKFDAQEAAEADAAAEPAAE